MGVSRSGCIYVRAGVGWWRRLTGKREETAAAAKGMKGGNKGGQV